MSNLTGRPVQPKIKDDDVPEKHERGCKCRSCIGRRNRRKGAEKQRAARKAVGVKPRFHTEGSDEERWSDSELLPGLRFEVKSGGQIPKWFINAVAQVEASRSFVGSLFKPAVILAPAGTSKQYLVVELSDLLELAQAWQETGRSSELKGQLRSIKKAVDEMERLL